MILIFYIYNNFNILQFLIKFLKKTKRNRTPYIKYIILKVVWYYFYFLNFFSIMINLKNFIDIFNSKLKKCQILY